MFHVRTIFSRIHPDSTTTNRTVVVKGDGHAQVILSNALHLARAENQTFDGLYSIYVRLATEQNVLVPSAENALIDTVHSVTVDERGSVPLNSRMSPNCPGILSYQFGSGPLQVYPRVLRPPSASVVRVGVVAIVRRGQSDMVLLGKRKGAHGAGCWALPGGHLEMWEDWADCATREIKEETGLDVSNFRFVHVSNDMMRADGRHYITIFVMASYNGADEPRLCEPDRCEEWRWVKWGEETIPQPRFIPLENLLKAGLNL